MIPPLLNRILVRSRCELRTGWDSRARLNGRRVTGGEAPSPFRACQKYISQAGSVSRAASLWWLSARYYMRQASPLDGICDEPGRPERAWFWCDEGLLSRAGPANAITWKTLSPVSRDTGSRLTGLRPVSRKPRKLFGPQKDIAKSRTLRLQSCFIHIFLIWTEVLFIQEVSGVYTSPFLDIDELKMALRTRKDSRVSWETGLWPGCHVIAKWAGGAGPQD